MTHCPAWGGWVLGQGGLGWEVSPEEDGQAHALPMGRMVPAWCCASPRAEGLGWFSVTSPRKKTSGFGPRTP